MNESKPSCPGIYTYETDSTWWYGHLRHTTTEKYDINGKSLYFRFNDDDDKISYEYILSITLTHTTPHFAKKIGKVTEIIIYILDTLLTEYTQRLWF